MGDVKGNEMAWDEEIGPTSQKDGERVYAFRRKGMADFCTRDGCNPDNCVGCGPTSHNHAHPEINEENSHE